MQAIREFREISRRRVRSGKETAVGDQQGSVSYCPYDKGKLLERIKSYPSLFVNEAGLNALSAARNGWEYVGERLRCVSCAAMLSVRVPSGDDGDDGDEFIKALIQRYIEELCTQHYRNCPWRVKPTPLEVYLMNELDESELVKFLERYASCLVCIDKVDEIQIQTTVNEEQVGVIQRFIVSKSLEFNYKMALVALYGWIITRLDNGMLVMSSHSDSRKLLIGDGVTVDLIEEHQPWDCFVDGYLKLLQLMKFVNEEGSTPLINRFDVMIDGDEIEEEGDVVFDSNVDDKLNDSLQRLEKLKSVYF